MTVYYKVLPYANGLPSREPADGAWHGGPGPWPPQRAPAGPAQLEQWAEDDLKDECFHPIATFADGRCVGASGAISFEVTVPGGTTVRMAGVTGTGVLATHRRRGHLRVVHRNRHGVVDGIANFRLPWSATAAGAGSLVVEAFEAANAVAYRALWELLTDFDLTLTIAALSSLYLGGMSAHDLAYAGHITAHADGAIQRPARLLRIDPEPQLIRLLISIR